MERDFSLISSKRLKYSNVKWRSTSGVETLIVEMTNEYISNVLRKCVEKQLVAERLHFMAEAQSYEDRTYEEWISLFTNEYLFRDHLNDVEITNILKNPF